MIWGGSITPNKCFRKREFKEFPLKTFQNHKKILTFAKNGNILYFLNEMGTLCLLTKGAQKIKTLFCGPDCLNSPNPVNMSFEVERTQKNVGGFSSYHIDINRRGLRLMQILYVKK